MSVLSLKFLFIVETACKKCGSWRKDGLSFFITLFVFFFCSYTTGSTIYISKWDFVFLLLVKFQRGDGGRKCGNGSRKENIGN